MRVLALIMGLLFAWGLSADDSGSKSAAKPAAVPATAAAPRVNLTGATARRNENVQLNRIDTDALKEGNIRMGDNVTVLPLAPVEASYYAGEHGRPPSEPVVLRIAPAVAGWHAEVFGAHQNSVFNARTFFQVGGVKPSRSNSYGGRFTGNLRGLGALTGNFSGRKVRGMVNGNVLVPLANERTSLSPDPNVRAVIDRYMLAYPNELPNRLDFDPRALNTNAQQRIDEIDGTLRLDRNLSDHSGISLSHNINRQRIDAFQLVAGQTPDTEIHNQRSRVTYRQSFSPLTDFSAGFAFNRIRSLLVPEPNAVGPRVRFGYQIEELGPDSHFPINRAQNSFRGGWLVSRRWEGGSHTLTFGGDITRFQLNGIETNNNRGLILFSNNFGRTAIENFRLGTPSTYEVTQGEMARGFRNWNANAFVADQWKITSKLQVYFGVRYSLESTPVEVDGLNDLPYGCDCNNFSPRFSVAYRPRGDWVIRANYFVSFGQIFPVTYQQVRYNPPGSLYFTVQNPSLLDPLAGIDVNDPNARTSPTFFSSDLVTPYSHQYNFSIENRFASRYLVRLSYVGSRSLKPLNVFIENRAEPVPGVPLTTATVDQRRPDPRYYDVKYIVNGGIAYMDAAQASFELPSTKGLTFGTTYTFGKALDQGADYAATAANRDVSNARAQSQYESFGDRKGLSSFDSTHAFLAYSNYDLPKIRSADAYLGWLLNGWQLSGSSLFKSGTPLTLYVGSDGPGYGNVDGGASDRPNIVDPSIIGMTIPHPDVAPLILRRDRFAYIIPGERRGSVGRGAFRKAGIRNWNAAITKQWRWGGSREKILLLRGEAFNLSNTPQFDEPQRNLSSPAFGKITNTLNDGRVFQFSLRFVL